LEGPDLLPSLLRAPLPILTLRSGCNGRPRARQQIARREPRAAALDRGEEPGEGVATVEEDGAR